MRKTKPLWGLVFVHLLVSHFAYEDPYQPEASCDDDHDDVEQETAKAVLLLVTCHFESFGSSLFSLH